MMNGHLCNKNECREDACKKLAKKRRDITSDNKPKENVQYAGAGIEIYEKHQEELREAEKRGAMKAIEAMEKMVEEADRENVSVYVGCMVDLENKLDTYKESLMKE